MYRNGAHSASVAVSLDTLTRDAPVSAAALRARWRAAVLPQVRGDVLDVGAGGGASLTHLSAARTITLLEPHGASVVAPAALLVLATIIAWGRRRDLAAIGARRRPRRSRR